MNLASSPSQQKQLRPFRKISRIIKMETEKSGSGRLNVSFLFQSKRRLPLWWHQPPHNFLLIYTRIHMYVKNVLRRKKPRDRIWGTRLGQRKTTFSVQRAFVSLLKEEMSGSDRLHTLTHHLRRSDRDTGALASGITASGPRNQPLEVSHDQRCNILLKGVTTKGAQKEKFSI